MDSVVVAQAEYQVSLSAMLYPALFTTFKFSRGTHLAIAPLAHFTIELFAGKYCLTFFGITDKHRHRRIGKDLVQVVQAGINDFFIRLGTAQDLTLGDQY